MTAALESHGPGRLVREASRHYRLWFRSNYRVHSAAVRAA